MKRTPRQTRLILRLFFAIALAVLVISARSSAQTSADDTRNSTAQSSSQPDQAHQPDSPGAMLTEETREAAGEEKGEGDELKKSPSVRLVARLTGTSLEHAYWLCVLLNFAVIAGVVIWISRTRLPGVFRGRTQAIQKAMQDARLASEDANRRLAEIEARLARLDSEIAGMNAAAEKESAEELSRIKAAAEADAHKIITSAEQEIAAAAKAARRDLKVFAADLSVDLARSRIRVDTPTDQALVRHFSDQLGDEKNGGGKDGH